MAPETRSLQRSVRKVLGSERCVESLAGIACFVLGTLPANVLKPPLRLGLPNADLRKPTASKHGWLWGSEPRVELCLGWRCGVFHLRSSSVGHCARHLEASTPSEGMEGVGGSAPVGQQSWALSTVCLSRCCHAHIYYFFLLPAQP